MLSKEWRKNVTAFRELTCLWSDCVHFIHPFSILYHTMYVQWLSRAILLRVLLQKSLNFWTVYFSPVVSSLLESFKILRYKIYTCTEEYIKSYKPRQKKKHSNTIPSSIKGLELITLQLFNAWFLKFHFIVKRNNQTTH